MDGSRERVGRDAGVACDDASGELPFPFGKRTSADLEKVRPIIRDGLSRGKRSPPHAVVAVVLGAAVTAGAAAPVLRFSDVTAEAGIDFVHVNGASPEKRMPETDGSGVAFVDVDSDGRQDIYFVNSGDLVAGRGGARNHLYRSLGNGHFADVPSAGGAAGDAYGMGVLAGDPDNDGDADLYLTAWGADQLYLNDGLGAFVDGTRSAHLGNPQWGSSAAYLDYDNDGDLDLFVANYVRFDLAKHPWCGRRDMDMRFYCAPREYEPTTDLLYRNEGDGTFTDVSAAAGIRSRGNGLGVVSADFDADGYADVYVANDMTPNFHYHNLGNGTFREEGMVTGTALSADGVSQAGMGVDAADYDRDGDLDLVVTNYQLENNALYRNDGRYFTEVSFAAGLGEASLNYLGFGTGFFDCDNDGWPDLFVANGHVHDNIELYDPLVTHAQRAQVFRNVGGGRFRDATDELGPALQRSYVGRGSAFADYDDDGDVDVALSTSGGPAVMLRNDGGNGRAWLRVRLRGTVSNREGVGARVRLFWSGGALLQQVRAGSGYQSTSEPVLHFGMGVAGGADSVHVVWPTGMRQRLGPQPAGRTVVVTEPR